MTAISSGASANHSSRPTTTEKTTVSAHRSTPIYYLHSRPSASATKPASQTTSHSHPQTHHSQNRLVIHHSKGSATDLRLPPSIVPSPSAATTDQQAPVQQRHHRHHSPFLALPIPSRITDPLLLRRRRQQWQQITEGNQMKETRKPKKTLDAKLINSATSSAMPPLPRQT
ncbi:hypothetical protein Peur_021224 [Populus x canadensis]